MQSFPVRDVDNAPYIGNREQQPPPSHGESGHSLDARVDERTKLKFLV
jgi:hypothetical protein